MSGDTITVVENPTELVTVVEKGPRGDTTEVDAALAAEIARAEAAEAALQADLDLKATTADLQAATSALNAALAAHEAGDASDAELAAAIADASAASSAAISAAQAYSIQRANHTGTQAISTVSGLQTALDGKETAGAAAAAQAASQPLDSDLTAIAALSTTSYGRSLLTQANAVAARSTLGVAPTWQSGTHATRIAISSPETGLAFYETDTGVLYRYTGSTWVAQTAGRIVKTADETVNNSASFQDDDHLFFPIEPNETWFVTATLLASAVSTTPDWQFTWTGPTGATGRHGAYGAANVTGQSFVTLTTAGTPATLVILGSDARVASAAGVHGIMLGAWIFNGSNAGTVKLRWSQLAATGEDHKLLTGSFIEPQRIA